MRQTGSRAVASDLQCVGLGVALDFEFETERSRVAAANIQGAYQAVAFDFKFQSRRRRAARAHVKRSDIVDAFAAAAFALRQDFFEGLIVGVDVSGVGFRRTVPGISRPMKHLARVANFGQVKILAAENKVIVCNNYLTGECGIAGKIGGTGKARSSGEGQRFGDKISNNCIADVKIVVSTGVRNINDGWGAIGFVDANQNVPASGRQRRADTLTQQDVILSGGQPCASSCADYGIVRSGGGDYFWHVIAQIYRASAAGSVYRQNSFVINLQIAGEINIAFDVQSIVG